MMKNYFFARRSLTSMGGECTALFARGDSQLLPVGVTSA